MSPADRPTEPRRCIECGWPSDMDYATYDPENIGCPACHPKPDMAERIWRFVQSEGPMRISDRSEAAALASRIKAEAARADKGGAA